MDDFQSKFRQEYSDATNIGLQMKLLTISLREWSDDIFGPSNVRGADFALDRIKESLQSIDSEGISNLSLSCLFLWTIEAAARFGLSIEALIDEAGYALESAKEDISLSSEKHNIEYLEPYLLAGGSDDSKTWIAEAYVGDQKLSSRGRNSDEARELLDSSIKKLIYSNNRETV